MPDLTLLDIPFELEKAIRLCRAGDSLSGKQYAAIRRVIEDERKIASGEYAPVVHAHWVGGYEHKGDVWSYTQPKCSNCHNAVTGGTSKYCPSCGALMGKDDSHEQD